MRFRKRCTLQAMLGRAEERFKPYSEVDMLLASKTMDAEDFAALRKEGCRIGRCPLPERGSPDRFYGESNRASTAETGCDQVMKVLQDAILTGRMKPTPTSAVCGGAGLPEEQVNVIVDPAVIQIINKARLFDQESGRDR